MRAVIALAVRPQTQVDPSVLSLLQQHGGKVQEANLEDYSVYIGHLKANGEEEGWVLGDAAALAALAQSIQSDWLRQRLRVGSVVAGRDVVEFERILSTETLAQHNIDGERVQEALLTLASAAKQDAGSIFVQ